MATKRVSKTTGREAKKSPTAKKTGQQPRAVARKPAPTEEEIRRKAEEIYHDRVAKGIYGTAEDDWHQAEKQLKNAR
ncbi:MAG: hypothetical protein ACP5D1_10120 [Bacteroidales bacterium]